MTRLAEILYGNLNHGYWADLMNNCNIPSSFFKMNVQYCQKLKEIMNLTSETPVDFDGIPEFNNQNCLCMPFKKDRADYIIQEQWEISKQILNDNINIELFDKILSNAHPYIGLSYLSRFCFIVKPEKYYPFDKQMAMNLNAKMPETYKGYNDYCKLLKYTYPEKTSYELSYEAFMENNNKQHKKQTNQKKYWLYSAGEKSYKWDEFYKDGIMAIGWDYLGDLTKYSSQEEIANKITKEENRAQYPMNDSKANWEFAKDMQIGDIVYVKKGLQDALIGRGIVKSDYIYDEIRNEYKSIRKVEWTHNGAYDVDFNILDIKQWNQKTLTEISQSKYKDFCLKIEDVFMNKQPEEKLNNLQVNIPLNQILYGPPGTGKTYNTVLKAMSIVDNTEYKNISDEQYSVLKTRFDELKQAGQIEFVTFHQSYSYEEFVEGIKPDLDTDSWNEPVDKLTYKGANGIFKTVANRALFDRLNIKTGQQDAILDFKNLKELFIEEYSVGSTFKTGTKNAEFRIDKYTKDSARITPINGKYTYSITFKYLEEAYNKKMSSQGEIATINGVASGLSCYYYAIYEKLLNIKKSNDSNQVKFNISEISDEDKLQLKHTKNQRSSKNMKPKFVLTKNVKGFINLIHNLKNKPDNISKIGLVYGNAGLGKTKTALYLSIQYDAVYIRATNSMSPKWMLEEIAKELDEIPRFYTADIFRQCVNTLKTNPQMIIVDEIDYLLKDFRTIETLRDLHDETGVPIILVGMQLAKHKLKKHTHLFDRISEIYNFTEFEYSDIKQITEEISEVEITKEAVHLIHNKAKSFRQIVNSIDILEKVAQANGFTRIDENIAKEVLNG